MTIVHSKPHASTRGTRTGHAFPRRLRDPFETPWRGRTRVMLAGVDELSKLGEHWRSTPPDAVLRALLETAVRVLDLEFACAVSDPSRVDATDAPVCAIASRHREGRLSAAIRELAELPTAKRPRCLREPASGALIHVYTLRFDSPCKVCCVLLGSARGSFPNELEQVFVRALQAHASFALERARAARQTLLLRKNKARVAELTTLLAKTRIALNSLRLTKKGSAVASGRHQLHRAILEQASGTGSFVWNPTRSRWTASDQLCRMLRLPPALHERRPSALLAAAHDDDRAAVEAAFATVAAGGAEYDGTFRIVHAEGTLAHVHCTVRRTAFGDELLGIVTDISERRRLEHELERAHRVLGLGELAASIAHQAAQPITALVANANACTRWLGACSPNLCEATASLKRIVVEGSRASQVLVSLRGLIAGCALRREPVPLPALLSSVARVLEPDPRAQEVRIDVRAQPDLPPAFGDRAQLQHVLLNLAHNALDAMSGTRDRQRSLQLSAERHGTRELRVLVRDTGPGLPQASRERAFEAFFSTKPDGMGIGLPISRAIIQAHDGQLWVTPNDDCGETFQFTLPLA